MVSFVLGDTVRGLFSVEAKNPALFSATISRWISSRLSNFGESDLPLWLLIARERRCGMGLALQCFPGGCGQISEAFAWSFHSPLLFEGRQRCRLNRTFREENPEFISPRLSADRRLVSSVGRLRPVSNKVTQVRSPGVTET